MTSPDPVRAALADMLHPLLERVQGRLVSPEMLGPDDVALWWDGEVRWGVRLPGAPAADLSEGLNRLIEDIQEEIGGPLSTLSRADKQRAVRLLEERGAFAMRKSAETVAGALGVTRFTVYNYLNRERGKPG